MSGTEPMQNETICIIWIVTFSVFTPTDEDSSVQRALQSIHFLVLYCDDENSQKRRQPVYDNAENFTIFITATIIPHIYTMPK
jgi:hypothetical protein